MLQQAGCFLLSDGLACELDGLTFTDPATVKKYELRQGLHCVSPKGLRILVSSLARLEC